MLASVYPEHHATNVLSVCLGNGNPNRLVSLWEIMNHFDAFGLASFFQKLLDVESRCDEQKGKMGGGAMVPPGLKAGAEGAIGNIADFCKTHNLDEDQEIESVKLSLAEPIPLDLSTL